MRDDPACPTMADLQAGRAIRVPSDPPAGPMPDMVRGRWSTCWRCGAEDVVYSVGPPTDGRRLCASCRLAGLAVERLP